MKPRHFTLSSPSATVMPGHLESLYARNEAQVILSIFGFSQGAGLCAFLLMRQWRTRSPWNVWLLVAVALLSLRLLMGATVHAGWFAGGPWAAAAGSTCAFLFWPSLATYVHRVATGTTAMAHVVATTFPVAAAMALALSLEPGRWFAISAAEHHAPADAYTLLPVTLGALVMIGYGGAIVAQSFRNLRQPCPPGRTMIHVVWLRPLSVLAALIPVSMLAAVGAALFAQGLRDVVALLAILCDVTFVQFVAATAIVDGRILARAPVGDRATQHPAVAVRALAIKESLLLHMRTNRPHHNPELRIADLAAALGVPAHVLSSVINEEFGKSFFDFVNGCRVEEACRLLLDPERRHYTVLSVALEVGFASKASFNRVFKKHTGATPSQYQRRGRHREPHSG